MKKVSSVVWKFFERLEENRRCVAVVCKLCDNEYKYFGNTTNLRVHLMKKHPIQWELAESCTNLDESSLRIDDSTNLTESSPKRKKYGSAKKNVGYSVSIDNNEDGTNGNMPQIQIQRVNVVENSDSDNDQDTLNLVRQMHGDQNSGEEWLEEDPYQITHIETYEPKPKRRKLKYRKIKREVTSPTDLPGFYVAPKPKPVVVESTSRKDEFSVFGEYIANKIRKLSTPRTRGNLQQLITTILWQAEYGLYDNADAVKRVLMLTIPDQETQNTVHFESSINETVQTEVVEQEEIIEQSKEGLGMMD